MRQQIVRLSPVQTAKVMAALYGLMGFVFIPFFYFAMGRAAGGESAWRVVPDRGTTRVRALRVHLRRHRVPALQLRGDVHGRHRGRPGAHGETGR